MDMINQLSVAEKCVAGGALLMFVASFLPWWHWSSGLPGLGSYSRGGWGDPGSTWSVLAILISLFLGGADIAQRLGNMTMPNLGNYTWGQAFGAGGALIVLFMLLKAWRISAAPAGGFGIGFFLGVVATAIIGYGCYLMYNADKGTGIPFMKR
jgi:hypothetical protein